MVAISVLHLALSNICSLLIRLCMACFHAGEGTTFSMQPVNEGVWGLVCRVNDHYNAGMKATYTVERCKSSKTETTTGKKRRFYIGIVEREWDYAEANRSMVHGIELDKDSG